MPASIHPSPFVLNIPQIFCSLDDKASDEVAPPGSNQTPTATASSGAGSRRFRAERLNFWGGLVVTEFSLDEVGGETFAPPKE